MIIIRQSQSFRGCETDVAVDSAEAEDATRNSASILFSWQVLHKGGERCSLSLIERTSSEGMTEGQGKRDKNEERPGFHGACHGSRTILKSRDRSFRPVSVLCTGFFVADPRPNEPFVRRKSRRSRGIKRERGFESAIPRFLEAIVAWVILFQDSRATLL